VITSHKPTYHYRSAYPNLDYFRVADKPPGTLARHAPEARGPTVSGEKVYVQLTLQRHRMTLLIHARINSKLLGFDGDAIGDRVQALPTSHPYCGRR